MLFAVTEQQLPFREIALPDDRAHVRHLLVVDIRAALLDEPPGRVLGIRPAGVDELVHKRDSLLKGGFVHEGSWQRADVEFVFPESPF